MKALPHDPDQPLVDACRRGDLHAFERLVDRHRDIVFRVAARVVGDDEAEDVAQDAFLRAFHRLPRFRGDAPFRAWLLQIAYNRALTVAAARSSSARREEEVVAERAPESRTPADHLESAERRRRLITKLRGLSPTHRTVLVLRDVEGMSYEEIAQVTDTPLGSVKGRLHRARGELIDRLRANTYDWELPR